MSADPARCRFPYAVTAVHGAVFGGRPQARPSDSEAPAREPLRAAGRLRSPAAWAKSPKRAATSPNVPEGGKLE